MIPEILGALLVFGAYWKAKNVGSASEGWHSPQHHGTEVLTSKMCRQAGNTANCSLRGLHSPLQGDFSLVKRPWECPHLLS